MYPSKDSAKVPMDLAERGFRSLKKQRATHLSVCRLQRFGSVLVVAVSIAVAGAYGQVSVIEFPDSNQLNGIATLDTYGGIGLVRSADGPDFFDQLWQFQRTATTETPLTWPFFVGFDIQRDLDLIADQDDEIVGVVAVDGFGGVHTFSLEDALGPDYLLGPNGVLEYNTQHPSSPLGLPYFTWDIVRDLELAVDWRAATNSYQGYYILDGFGGVHYVNDAELLAMIQGDLERATPEELQSDPLVGTEDFFSILGFRPVYRRHFVGPGFSGTEAERAYLSRAPYVQDPNFAKDLEVSARFFTVSSTHVADSQNRSAIATNLGVTESSLTTPIPINAERADISSQDFGRDVAVTNGYYILSSYGVVHSMVEDGKGNPIPALWEDPNTGLFDPQVKVPYFGFDVAEALELFPNGLGFALLDAWGGIHLVSAPGAELSDSFDLASFSDTEQDPSTLAPYFGFNIGRGLKLVTYVDRANYGLDNDSDGEADPVDPKHAKIIGYYVLDGFGTVYGIGDVADIPPNGTVLPLYGVDVSADLELSPLFRPVTDSVTVLFTTVSESVQPLYYPVADSI